MNEWVHRLTHDQQNYSFWIVFSQSSNNTLLFDLVFLYVALNTPVIRKHSSEQTAPANCGFLNLSKTVHLRNIFKNIFFSDETRNSLFSWYHATERAQLVSRKCKITCLSAVLQMLDRTGCEILLHYCIHSALSLTVYHFLIILTGFAHTSKWSKYGVLFKSWSNPKTHFDFRDKIIMYPACSLVKRTVIWSLQAGTASTFYLAEYWNVIRDEKTWYIILLLYYIILY